MLLVREVLLSHVVKSLIRACVHMRLADAFLGIPIASWDSPHWPRSNGGLAVQAGALNPEPRHRRPEP